MLAIITRRRRSKGCFGEGVRGIFALLLDKGKETSALRPLLITPP